MRRILSILDLSAEQFQRVIDEAIDNEGRAIQRCLEGKNVGIWFDQPSTRTRTAFTLASSILGASIVEYKRDEMQLTTGESLLDTAKVLAQFLDILVIRGESFSQLQTFCDAGIPLVINALTDEEHPTQALADYMTLKRHFGRLEELRILFIGDGGNIATSLMLAGCRLCGAELHFITPRRYGFTPGIIGRAFELAKEYGAHLEYHHDPGKLPRNVDAVYTTRWRSLGKEKTDPDWRKDFEGFQINGELLAQVSGSNTVILHDLPAERGAEIDAAILDSTYSLVLQQAGNKLATARSLLGSLVNHR